MLDRRLFSLAPNVRVLRATDVSFRELTFA
jgi:hypothetical protein